jgi:FkbM family methyltransferase
MYHSQDKQDQFLEENIFRGYKNGIFVDVGAHDGITINNTLFFEKERNWTGINVEPIPSVFEKLKESRPNCINLNIAVDEKDSTADFILNIGHTEMISGLSSSYDVRHHARREVENSMYGSKSSVINVKTKTLKSILSENDIKHVNYLSIDVEGAEFSVIKSIDFNNIFIDVIGFENNYKDASVDIVKFLEEKGFIVIDSRMDIMMIHKESRFRK